MIPGTAKRQVRDLAGQTVAELCSKQSQQGVRGGAQWGLLYLVPRGGLGLLSRTRGREEVLTGRVLDLGKPRWSFCAVSVSLIGSSVGPSRRTFRKVMWVRGGWGRQQVPEQDYIKRLEVVRGRKECFVEAGLKFQLGHQAKQTY